MSVLVIDSSIAMKWVVPEPGTAEAILVQRRFTLVAPDLLMAECANVLWKKVSRGEISGEEASIAARVLEQADIELVSGRTLVDASVRLAIGLEHPAYDCAYVALAALRRCRFATADHRLIDALGRSARPELRDIVLSLTAAASGSG
ncbi:MAG: type II toxin-antitoxin system VapC family toxin [Xanthobacteraceae bacterium]